MPKPFLPAFADLSQDIAGEIPVGIIEDWLQSDGSAEAHARILAPFERRGTFVSSDSAGLSKLSLGKSLIEVMKLVSQPKEIIHALGTAIGGQAVGIWIADNTQMFYPSCVPMKDVVRQMLAVQNEAAKCLVKVGIGIHVGVAYEIGGGLYGADADDVEHATEEESKAGEVMVSKTVKAIIGENFIVDNERAGYDILKRSPSDSPVKIGTNNRYPAPFDAKFFAELQALDLTDNESLAKLERARLQMRTVVLLRVFHTPEELLLNTLTKGVSTNSLMNNVLKRYDCNLINMNGSLMIVTLEQSAEAVDLALALHETARENELTANVGVVSGNVLIFDLGNGKEQIAGSPVNVASKLAEDTDERNAVFLESSVAEHAPQHGLTSAFTVSKSGVELTGIRVSF